MTSEVQDPEGSAIGVYQRFSACVVGIETESVDGDIAIGTAVHIGDGILLTARHIVEDRTIRKLVTQGASVRIETIEIIYPSDPDTDVALLKSDFRTHSVVYAMAGSDVVPPSHIEIGGHLDDWIGDSLVLMPVTVFGYPPIPTSDRPVLVAARGEVNAVIDPYMGGSRHPKFVISPLARGGFSGGPVLANDSWLLGVVTDSLVSNNDPAPLGFHAVTTIEPILNLLFENKIYPGKNAELMYMLRSSWDVDGDSIPIDDEARMRIDKLSEYP